MANAMGHLLTGILVLLPVAAVLSLLAVAPGYVQSMGAAGRLALSSAGCAQIAINLSIRKVVDLSVHRIVDSKA